MQWVVNPIDATPTSGSTNAVQSGGVADAINSKFYIASFHTDNVTIGSNSVLDVSIPVTISSGYTPYIMRAFATTTAFIIGNAYIQNNNAIVSCRNSTSGQISGSVYVSIIFVKS